MRSWRNLKAFARAVTPVTGHLRIPLKVISESGVIPIASSEVKPIIYGAKRRWRSYSA